MAALASVPVYGMSLSDHNAFHNILTEMQDGKKKVIYYFILPVQIDRIIFTVSFIQLKIFLEVWQEHEATTNQQAISIMDLILQDLDKIDQFHHNYEMMTHGETSRSRLTYIDIKSQVDLALNDKVRLISKYNSENLKKSR